MNRNKKSFKKDLILILKGIAMGAANKVPGVSGGIVAFVAGFYEELIYSLQKINLKAFTILVRKGWPAFYQYICLLYTSPSPRDATLSRMPSSA